MTPEELRQRKDMVTLSLCAVLVTAAAGAFAVFGDAPHVLALTVLGLGGSLALRRPLPRTSRTFVYAAVAVLAVAVLSDQFFPVSPSRFFLLPADVYAPPLIYFAVAATFFDQRETNIAAIIAAALLVAMLAGNALHSGMDNTRWAGSQPLIDHAHAFFGVVVAVQAGSLLLLLRRIEPRKTRRGPSRTRHSLARIAVVAGSIALAALSVVGLRRLGFVSERLLQRVFEDVFRRYAFTRRVRYVFGREVDLWCTVPYRAGGDQAIVLRATAEEAPGYLRGRTYTTYSGGRWSSGPTTEELPASTPEGQYSFTVFSREQGTGEDSSQAAPNGTLERWSDFYTSARFHSDVILAPGDATKFALIAAEMGHDANGVLCPASWDSRTGYSVLRRAGPEQPAPYPRPPLPTPPPGQYLHIPAPLAEPLTEIATGVFAPDSPHDAETGIASLSAFFSREFSYELGVTMDGSSDPVLQFLLHHHRGHCELFATAAVLLLRQRGIPARYVTGFVCAERHPYGSHWISRLKHAHAWAEAYDSTEERWRLVECTPPDGMPDGTSELSLLDAWLDRAALFWQVFMTKIRRGHLAQALATAALTLFAALCSALTHPIAGPAVLAPTVVGMWFLWRRWAARHRQSVAGHHETTRALRMAVAKLEKRLRRHGIVRAPHGTWRDLARMTLASDHIADGRETAGLLYDYERLRYRGDPPSREAVKAFTSAVARHLRSTGGR